MYDTLRCAPENASSADMSMDMVRSPPLTGLFDRAAPGPPAPPKMDEKSNPPNAPSPFLMLSNISDQSAPFAPVVYVYVRLRPPEPPKSAPGMPPNISSWSYSLRFWGSESVVYASLISLNFCASPPASGWYFTASLRKAFLISSASASRFTPRMS